MSTAWYQPDARATGRQYVASKVPTITGLFWVIKILTTGMGEATSDYLVHTYNPYLAVLAGAVLFAIAMAAQFATKRYVTWVYWFAVVMVSVFGTMCADVTHIVLGVPYAVSTTAFVIILAVVFTLWYRSEGTLSIHSIHTPRRELFYWATVLATFALGTAAGDMTARTLHLGFLSSGIMFAVVFAIPAIGNWKLGLNPILAFWFAYIVTRPLGASFADWLAIGPRYGGLGLGYGLISAVSTVFIVIGVAVLAVTGQDVEERGRDRAGPGGAGAGGARAGGGRAGGGRHRSAAGGPAAASPAGPVWAQEPQGYGTAYGPGGGDRAWPGYEPGAGGYRPDPGGLAYGPGGGLAPGSADAARGGRPAGPPVPPPDRAHRYGPADQTRRLARPGAVGRGPDDPAGAGAGDMRGPGGRPAPPRPAQPGAGEPRRYGPADQTRPAGRRDLPPATGSFASGPPGRARPAGYPGSGGYAGGGYPGSGQAGSGQTGNGGGYAGANGHAGPGIGNGNGSEAGRGRPFRPDQWPPYRVDDDPQAGPPWPEDPAG